MFKVNNKNTRTTPIVTLYSSVSIVNFEQVNADWGTAQKVGKELADRSRGLFRTQSNIYDGDFLQK